MTILSALSAKSPATDPATQLTGPRAPRRRQQPVVERKAFASSVEHAVLALVAYVPLLAVDPGVVTDDTKTYLYLDPTKFLKQVAFMWDPSVALGTVSHQTLGYLLPMGPFFWLFHVIGVPVWIAQRLWLGSILFMAGAGMLYLCRVLRVHGPGPMVAGLAFMLSPYFLQYAGRISVILLPWAGLPWLVALAAQSLRRRGWRYPALFALVVALVSGINATAVIYVGLAPALWLLYATAVEREARWTQMLLEMVKLAGLSLLVSLWWIAGLQVEAAYGVNVLKYTETIPATSQTSSASEVLRGLGYWYFYGGDRDGPWTFASVVYTQYVWVLVVSFLVPVLAFLSGVLVRWRERAFFVGLVVVGVVLSVGAHPYDNPTPVGGVLKAFMTDTTAGLALRSTDRATPLVVLGLAMLLGTGATAVWRRIPWMGLVTGLVLAALVVADNPAIFNGDTIANGMTQPASLPAYEQAAIKHLNATHKDLRVLAIPGDDFAELDWGDTVDTPQPALLNRPFAIQEQQIMGSMPTADVLYASDEDTLLGTEQTSSLAPMARLMSAGDVMLENDTAYWDYGDPQPQLLWEQLQPTPPGLSDPRRFGSPVNDVSAFSTLDEEDLAAPSNPKPPPRIVTYTVDDPRPIVRGESDTGAVIVAGDSTGLDNMASTGLLNTSSAIYFAGTLDNRDRKRQLDQLMSGGAQLVLTDTNRKQAFRWDALTANTGFTETPSENLAKDDPSDSPLNLFPGSGTSSKTTAYYLGAVNVTASSYGDPVSYLPENRAYMAVDGNPDTSWETGTFMPSPVGQWWQIALKHPVTASQVTLTQPLEGNTSRWITRVTLTFKGSKPVTVDLGKSSRTSSGQVVTFPARSFSKLRIRIDRTSDDHASTLTAGPVGFSSISIPGVSVLEVVKMPTDLLSKAGAASLDHRLTIVMTRQRVSPYPVRTDPETVISRELDLPTARTFTLSGTASISALVPDNEIADLVGNPGAVDGGVVANSSGRLPGDLKAGASAAIDSNPRTAWQPGFGAAEQTGSWLQYNLPHSITADHMDLQVLADGRHSVPTQMVISTDSGSDTVDIPPISDSRVAGSVASVPLSFPALSGSNWRVTFTHVRLEYTTNYYSSTPIALPLGIADLGIPGLSSAPDPTELPGACQSNLITIDGNPVSVRIVGTSADARAGDEMTVQPCGADAGGITLGPGEHVIETATGHTPSTGWNIDQLVLDSAAGGAAEPDAPAITTTSSTLSSAATSGTTLTAATPGAAPTVKVTSQHTDSMALRVSNASDPFELVLGQSVNPGWKAVASPGPSAPPGSHAVTLGTSELVDAFANGWQVTASDLKALGGSDFTVALTWTPQTRVWIALAISGFTILACLLVAFLPRSWRQSLWRRGLWARDRLRQSLARISLRRGDRERHVVHSGRPGPVPDGVGAARGETGPVLMAPWRSPGRRPPRWAIPLIALGSGLVTAAISYPLVGLAAAVIVAVALAVQPARLVIALAAVGTVTAAAVTVVYGQVQHHLLESSNWPTSYEGAGVLAMVAVVFLGLDAVTEISRRVAGRRRSAELGGDGIVATGSETGEPPGPVDQS